MMPTDKTLNERYHEAFLRLVENLAQDHSYVKVERNELRFELSEYQAKVDSLTSQLEAERALHTADADEQSTDEELAAKLEQALEENEKLKTAFDAEEKRTARAARARKVAREKLERKTAEYNELLTELHEARAQLEKVRAADAGDAQRVAQLNDNLDVAQRTLEEYKTALEEITEQLEAEKNDHAQSKKQLSELASLQEKLEKSLTDAAQKDDLIKELRAQLDAAGCPQPDASTVDVAGVRRHLENAKRTFDEDPDKCYRAITRAQKLLDPAGPVEEDE